MLNEVTLDNHCHSIFLNLDILCLMDAFYHREMSKPPGGTVEQLLTTNPSIRVGGKGSYIEKKLQINPRNIIKPPGTTNEQLRKAMERMAPKLQFTLKFKQPANFPENKLQLNRHYLAVTQARPNPNDVNQ